MIQIIPDKSFNMCKTYRTERFCTLLDRNIVLSVETRGDGSEWKTCQDINICKNKSDCKYKNDKKI